MDFNYQRIILWSFYGYNFSLDLCDMQIHRSVHCYKLYMKHWIMVKKFIFVNILNCG